MIRSTRPLAAFAALAAALALHAGAARASDVDALYPPDFAPRRIAADPIPPIDAPKARARSWDEPSWVDPVHRTRVYKATDAADYPGATRVRHDYSRRQAFNADNSRYLAMSSNGHWLLYDGRTFEPLRRGGHGGALKGLGGDAEAIWHPTDPKRLWYTAPYGGLVWYEKDVEADTDTVMADFRGRLPWPGATSVWTKGEGTSSADGRYFAFMASSYDEAAKRNTIHGLFTYDRQENRIVGTLDASAFGEAWPDHIGISPSGRFAVPSWANRRDLGTRAYTLDFKSHRVLHTASEHADLAIGPDGQDLYVATNYERGVIFAVDCATGASFDLMPMYPRRGSGYAAHVSGKAFGRPGWVVISTYADFADHGKTTPDPVLQPMTRKVMLVELRRGGRQYGVAHTRTAARYGGYYGEPQASISRDGSRIVFATNFDGGGEPSSYVVAVPSAFYR